MTNVRDVPANTFIEYVAKDLKNNQNVKKPEFTKFVKTGPSKERAPQDNDWWYVRMASIFRKIYITGKVNVKSLRSYYGSKKNRGVRPEKFFKAGGKIIRVCLQNLEKLGFVKIADDGGRVLTSKGQGYLDKLATQLLKETKDTKVKVKEEVVKEVKEKKAKPKEEVVEAKEEIVEETKEKPIETKEEIVKESKDEKPSEKKKEDKE